MDYNVWIENIEKLKIKDDYMILEKMKNSLINENINEMLIPKLIDLIKLKTENSVNSIIKELENIFLDINYCDLVLLNLKKNIEFIKQIVFLKQIPDDIRENALKEIEKNVEDTYKILISESYKYDSVGAFEVMIKNNKIKWRDE